MVTSGRTATREDENRRTYSNMVWHAADAFNHTAEKLCPEEEENDRFAPFIFTPVVHKMKRTLYETCFSFMLFPPSPVTLFFNILK